MFFNLILRILLFFQICFFIKCDEKINILDNKIKGYFDSGWVAGTNNEDIILVKMEKENQDLDDYNSTFSCEREFIYKGNNYKLKITVSKNHNLEYKIQIKSDDIFREVTDVEKELFYRDPEDCDGEGNPIKFYKTTKSLFYSNNWVLLKLKTNDEKEFYAFINNIYPITTNEPWIPLGYSSRFLDVYIIYSNISYIPYIASSRVSVEHKLIDLTGLNFEDNDNAYMGEWFCNCKNLITFKNIPKFNKSINISRMLDGCESLEDVDLGENTIIGANNCFKGCEKLKNINLKNVKITKNANLSQMFLNCKNIKNIEGFKTFIEEKDNPNLENMLEGAEVDGELDLTLWGTNILPKKFIKNGKVKSLKLFNLKKILQYYIKSCKEKIQKLEEGIKDNEKELEEYKKKLENLKQKELKTNKDEEDIKNLEKNIKITENSIKRRKDNLKQYQDEIDGNGKGLNILEDSTVDELYINEEFMPEDKKDLDKLIGNNCITKMIYIIDKDGKCKKYKDFNDYKNNIEYKDEEQQDIPINPQIPEKIENVDEKEIPKGNTCINCCGKCFKSCCCCCHKNSRKRSNSI